MRLLDIKIPKIISIPATLFLLFWGVVISLNMVLILVATQQKEWVVAHGGQALTTTLDSLGELDVSTHPDVFEKELLKWNGTGRLLSWEQPDPKVLHLGINRLVGFNQYLSDRYMLEYKGGKFRDKGRATNLDPTAVDKKIVQYEVFCLAHGTLVQRLQGIAGMELLVAFIHNQEPYLTRAQREEWIGLAETFKRVAPQKVAAGVLVNSQQNFVLSQHIGSMQSKNGYWAINNRPVRSFIDDYGVNALCYRLALLNGGWANIRNWDKTNEEMNAKVSRTLCSYIPIPSLFAPVIKGFGTAITKSQADLTTVAVN